MLDELNDQVDAVLAGLQALLPAALDTAGLPDIANWIPTDPGLARYVSQMPRLWVDIAGVSRSEDPAMGASVMFYVETTRIQVGILLRHTDYALLARQCRSFVPIIRATMEGDQSQNQSTAWVKFRGAEFRGPFQEDQTLFREAVLSFEFNRRIQFRVE